jgi:hypothetical protein
LSENWKAVDMALRKGFRGLSGGSSLARLLVEKRGHRNRLALPRFSIPEILDWADAYRKRRGKWPHVLAGAIPEAPGETWVKVNNALDSGCRGLPGGSSLARLLARHRGARHPLARPKVTIKQILHWADLHYQRTGAWPNARLGTIPGALGETWATINRDLEKGLRGLPGHMSLARLLAKYRGVLNPRDRSRLSIKQILYWADVHFKKTGKWPKCGPREKVLSAAHENWGAINNALYHGFRGLPGGDSLAALLEKHRGVRQHQLRPDLAINQILAWADAHRARTGNWPNRVAGPVPEMPGEEWATVEHSIAHAHRGLPPGMTLRRLLLKYRRGAYKRKARNR